MQSAPNPPQRDPESHGKKVNMTPKSPPAEEATPTELAPVEPSERYPVLDVLRGFALLGILLVNMEDFSATNVAGLAPVWSDQPDQVVNWLLRFAAEGKFRALFAFLFGIGFAL